MTNNNYTPAAISIIIVIISTVQYVDCQCTGTLISQSLIATRISNSVNISKRNMDVYDMLPYPIITPYDNLPSYAPIASDFNYADYCYIDKVNNTENFENQKNNKEKTEKTEKSEKQKNDKREITMNGSMMTLLSFMIGTQDKFCFYAGEQVQVPGKGFATIANPFEYRVYFQSLVYKYGRLDNDIVATNVELDTHCHCDCPGGDNSCDSSTNYCGQKGYNLCANDYYPGQTRSGCGNLFGNGEVCCANVISNYGFNTISTISREPQRTYIIVIEKWRGSQRFYSKSYEGTLDNTATFGSDGIQLKVVTAIESSIYKGGNRFLVGARPWRLADEWNTANAYDQTRGGWIKIRNGAPSYTTTSLANAASHKINKCGGGIEYDVTYNYHKSQPTSEISAEQYLKQYGLVGYEGANNFLYLSPLASNKYLMTLQINESNIIYDFRLVGISDFACNGSYNEINGGSIICNTSTCEDFGAFRFFLRDSKQQIISSSDKICEKSKYVYWTIPLPGGYFGENMLRACASSSIKGEICAKVIFTTEKRVFIDTEWVETVKNDTSTGGTNDSDNPILDDIKSGWNKFTDFFKTALGISLTSIITIVIVGGIIFLIMYCCGVPIVLGCVRNVRNKIQMKISNDKNVYKPLKDDIDEKYTIDDVNEMDDFTDNKSITNNLSNSSITGSPKPSAPTNDTYNLYPMMSPIISRSTTDYSKYTIRDKSELNSNYTTYYDEMIKPFRKNHKDYKILTPAEMTFLNENELIQFFDVDDDGKYKLSDYKKIFGNITSIKYRDDAISILNTEGKYLVV